MGMKKSRGLGLLAMVVVAVALLVPTVANAAITWNPTSGGRVLEAPRTWNNNGDTVAGAFMPPEERAMVSSLVILMGIQLGFSLPASTTSAVLRGLQRYEMVNLLAISGLFLLRQ